FVGSSDNNLYVLDASDGSLLWKFQTEGAVLSSPVVKDSTAFFASGDRKFYAVNINDQSLKWKPIQMGMMSESRPFIQEETIYFNSWDGNVYAVDINKGSIKWKWRRTANFYYAPAACWPVFGMDKIFVTDPQRFMSAIDAGSGTTVWSSKSPEFWESIGISEDGKSVYGRSIDGNLYAFSTEVNYQHQLWSANTDYGWDSTPSMPGEKDQVVFTGSKKGFVAAVNSTNGELLWKYWAANAYTSTVTPVSSHEVVVATLDGKVNYILSAPLEGEIDESRSDKIPETYALFQSYPNPFNMNTVIRYALPRSSEVEIDIFNILGQRIFNFKKTYPTPGYYSVLWDGRDQFQKNVASGLYIYRLRADNFVDSRKTLLIR
ncbi:MAG: PQQ-binding-like beta-propeller repeat protein, partial [Fidelibacterota bacterium]